MENTNSRSTIAARLAAMQADPAWKWMMSLPGLPSVFDVLRISDNEVRHTYFIQWLLDPSGTHCLRDRPLRRFLGLIGHALEEPRHAKAEWFGEPNRWQLADTLRRGDYSLEVDRLSAEVPCHASDRRMDIFGELRIRTSRSGDVHLVRFALENKVSADEHDEQTIAYWQDCHDRPWMDSPGHRHVLGLFLSPRGSCDVQSLGEPECACKNFIQINYQAVLEQVLIPCLNDAQVPDVAYPIRQYIRTLAFSRERKVQTMALAPQDRALLREFWLKHKDLISTLADVEQDDPELSEEDREQLAAISRAKAPMPPFIQLLRDELGAKPIGSDWKSGDRQVNCLTLNYQPLSHHLKVIRQNKPGFKVERLGFYVGRNSLRQPPCIELRFEIHGTIEECSDQDGRQLIKSLREWLREPIKKIGGKPLKSTYLCRWSLPEHRLSPHAQAEQCMLVIQTLAPLVKDWYARQIEGRDPHRCDTTDDRLADVPVT